ncbi:TetR/AcrR family transcriptional regulator [Shimia biformata]|uniref:TetR/AcrR family transcriptional regulator n=1 Tax=Shimia biformata TaxID=1294299 RepID=UPI00195031DB|nr:TetR/AcrR family transcriptional regulator [Shimia biformata]
MTQEFLEEKQRQRAPSQKALATRERIFDAAERVFAAEGFDAAGMRSIAAQAGVRLGLVSHHGGSKEELFWKVVARRADQLSALRLTALQSRKAQGPITLTALLECFFGPYLEKAEVGGRQWLAYARIVAMVSADPRWRELAAVCFDPTAGRFIDEISALYPTAPRPAVAAGFVYSVSAMLALLTSRWRIAALGDPRDDAASHLDELVTFCAAGIDASLRRAQGISTAARS